MTYLSSLFVLLLVQTVSCEDIQKVRASLSTGIVEGFLVPAEHGTARIFKKIPYAAAPVGQLRFASPHPPSSWSGIRDATQAGASCPQNYTFSSPTPYASDVPKTIFSIDEDCLFVNVYADDKCNELQPCPVVFYIHGGSFEFDSPNMFNDSDIVAHYASRSMIVVMVGYRLGVLGHLDVGDQFPDAPFNPGFLDVIAALRWTQREISAFGGNPRDIIVFGHSSAGYTVAALLTSPAVEANAFSKAIVFSPAHRIDDRLNKPKTQYVLTEVGCVFDEKLNTLSHAARIECLRNKSVEEILHAQTKVQDKVPEGYSGLQPDGFSYNTPTVESWRKDWKPVPLLMSVTSIEADFNAGTLDNATCPYYASLICNRNPFECRKKCESHVSEDPRIPPVSVSFEHSFAWFLARINSIKGAPSWFHVWDQYHANGHADELIFAMGLHADIGFHAHNVGHLMMRKFFPRLLRKFIFEGKMVDGWLPMDHNGANYYYDNIKAVGHPTNYTIVQRPHFVRGEIYDAQEIHFWLSEVGHVDRRILDLPEDVGRPSQPGPGAGPCPPSGAPWWAFILLVVAVALLAVALFVVVGVPTIWKTRQSNKH